MFDVREEAGKSRECVLIYDEETQASVSRSLELIANCSAVRAIRFACSRQPFILLSIEMLHLSRVPIPVPLKSHLHLPTRPLPSLFPLSENTSKLAMSLRTIPLDQIRSLGPLQKQMEPSISHSLHRP